MTSKRASWDVVDSPPSSVRKVLDLVQVVFAAQTAMVEPVLVLGQEPRSFLRRRKDGPQGSVPHIAARVGPLPPRVRPVQGAKPIPRPGATGTHLEQEAAVVRRQRDTPQGFRGGGLPLRQRGGEPETVSCHTMPGPGHRRRRSPGPVGQGFDPFTDTVPDRCSHGPKRSRSEKVGASRRAAPCVARLGRGRERLPSRSGDRSRLPVFRARIGIPRVTCRTRAPWNPSPAATAVGPGDQGTSSATPWKVRR